MSLGDIELVNRRGLRASSPALGSRADALARGRLQFLVAPFILGGVSAQHLGLGGQLYVGELLAVLYLLGSLWRVRMTTLERRMFLFAAMWSTAQLLSDLYNQTPVLISLKGVLAPLVLVATVLGLGVYFRTDITRMPSFLLGVTSGAVISLAVAGSAYFSDNEWKWGIGAVVLGLFTIHYSFFLRRKSLAWLFIGLSAFLLVSLYFDARSLAFLPLLAGVLYAKFRSGGGEGLRRVFGGQWGLLWLLPVVLVAAIALNAAATAVFSSGYVLSRSTPTEASKYQGQTQGRYGVLLGGRPEALVSAQAFLDSPWLGHGSWAIDPGQYQAKLAELRQDLGYSQSHTTSPLIPTHSYLMGALVWSGVIGGLFWVVVLSMVFKQFIAVAARLPLYFYVGVVGFTWDVLFSPFGASARWGTAVFLAAFLAYSRMLLPSEADR